MNGVPGSGDVAAGFVLRNYRRDLGSCWRRGCGPVVGLSPGLPRSGFRFPVGGAGFALAVRLDTHPRTLLVHTQRAAGIGSHPPRDRPAVSSPRPTASGALRSRPWRSWAAPMQGSGQGCSTSTATRRTTSSATSSTARDISSQTTGPTRSRLPRWNCSGASSDRRELTCSALAQPADCGQRLSSIGTCRESRASPKPSRRRKDQRSVLPSKPVLEVWVPR
jgi:hypothetical protein